MSTRGGPENREPVPVGQPGTLEQIREILFGAIHRDLERKLARADAQLASRAAEIDQEIRRRTDILEAHVRDEVEALAARVEKQNQTISEAVGGAARESRSTSSALEQRMARLEESFGRIQRDLRQQMLEQAKSFLDELHRVRGDLAALIEREYEGYRPETGPGAEDEHHAPGP
jgi:hypothetical protein